MLKKFPMFILGLLVVLAISGCFGRNIIPSTKTGSLQVSISIPKDLVPVQSRGTLDGITVSKVDFTITNGTKTFTKTETVNGDTVNTVFPNLQPGDWDIEVVAKEVVGSTEYEVFGGYGQGTVIPSKTTSVPVEMNLVNGSMSLVIAVPEDYTEAQTLKITLSNGVSTPLTKELTMLEAQDPIVFNDLLPTGWNVKVEAFDINEILCAEGSKVIDAKPGRTVDVYIAFGIGVLTIEPIWNMPPAKPVNLTATKLESAIKLTWEPSSDAIKGYSVARSTSIDGDKVRLTDTLLTSCEYTDSDFYPEDTYYYWVSAYADNGLYSGWEGPVEITF